MRFVLTLICLSKKVSSMESHQLKKFLQTHFNCKHIPCLLLEIFKTIVHLHRPRRSPFERTQSHRPSQRATLTSFTWCCTLQLSCPLGQQDLVLWGTVNMSVLATLRPLKYTEIILGHSSQWTELLPKSVCAYLEFLHSHLPFFIYKFSFILLFCHRLKANDVKGTTLSTS